MQEKIDALVEKGSRYLKDGQFERAERAFKKAAALGAGASVVNNWAVSRFYRGDYEETLRILEPNLASPMPNPFAHAVAAQCLVELGRKDEARVHLDRAIRDFDKGLHDPFIQTIFTRKAWGEYTVMIERAAGALGEHRLVLDLYRRWEQYHVLPEDRFLAGVAAFNLRRYRQAISHWRHLPMPDWEFIGDYVRVAGLLEEGIIPAFPLEYHPPGALSHGEKASIKSDEDAEQLAQLGTTRILVLAQVFDEESDERESAFKLRGLILLGGEWGVQLGRQLLSVASISRGLKGAIIHTLVELGAYKEGEAIPILEGGEMHEVKYRRTQVIDILRSEWECRVREVRRQREAGRIDEAIKVVSDLVNSEVFYPPAALVLATLLRMKGELDAAYDLLSTLEEMMPGHPVILFNIAALWLQRGDKERARSYASRIDPSGQGQEFREKLRELQSYL
ncbi:MAG: hypothetical protein HPY71_02800 [Firmicutes bacterium]|nr:hypothetical protein [Bacillota bacterium]